jgi:hypothetical protein
VAAAPSQHDLSLAPTSTPPAGAVADSPAELPVAANVGMVAAPPPMVIPDLPILGHEERTVVVAEVGDQRPATLAKERPVCRRRWYPMHRMRGDPTPRWRGHAESWPVLGSSDLIPAQLNPNEWGGQPLLFWSRVTSDSEPLLSLNDELEERSRDNFREYTQAAMRSLWLTMEILSRGVPRVFQVRT